MNTDYGFDTSESDVQSVGSTYFAEYIKDAKSTPKRNIDEVLQSLESHKREWAQLEIGERLLLLEEVRNDLWAIKDLWIQSELEAHKVDTDTKLTEVKKMAQGKLIFQETLKLFFQIPHMPGIVGSL